MKKLYSLSFIILFMPFISANLLTDTEKRSLAQEKLTFIDSQKAFLDEMNYVNKCIYKQAERIAAYVLKDDFASVKQQVKSAVTQILATQECLDYYHYKVMLTMPLIGRDHIKAKQLPIVRPNQTLAKRINEILAATIPVALLGHIEVLTYFESYLNYKMDLMDSQLTVTKLHIVEKEIETFLASLVEN